MDINEIKPCFINGTLEYKKSKLTIKYIDIYSVCTDNYILTSCDLFMGTRNIEYEKWFTNNYIEIIQTINDK